MYFSVYITLPPPPAPCPAPLTACACDGIMRPDVGCQSQLATRCCASTSMDVIDDVVSVSSAYCYVISRHTESMICGRVSETVIALQCRCTFSTLPLVAFCPMSDYTPLTARLLKISVPVSFHLVTYTHNTCMSHTHTRREKSHAF